jgi:DNA-binding response OmpR family regulator
VRILVVEDHDETRRMIQRTLKEAGHLTEGAGSVAEARRRLAAGRHGMIVLDCMLPDGSGLDLCRELRTAGAVTPVLVLTARRSVGDRVEGLDAGADDYLPKPFAVAELLARIRALQRRGPRLVDPVVHLPGIEVRLTERRLLVEGREVPLTGREFAILEILLRRCGRPVSRADILNEAWGERGEAGGASMEVLITRLRRKLSTPAVPDPIRTHRGFGYSIGGGSEA